MPRICIVPAVDGTGGMASFRFKFEAGLRARGIEISHDPDTACDAILVIGGTKNLLPLWKARRRGVRIVQRLDGINWVQRKRRTPLKHFLRAEYGNFVLSLIRSKIATRILYQSEFSRRWWDNWYGHPEKPAFVVHNGVDLNAYRPDDAELPASEWCRLLIVEGNLGGGYEMGLENALSLGELLSEKFHFRMELMVVGKISDELKRSVESKARIPLRWAGSVAREQIPGIDRSAHVLFSADLNAACPNSVIEAMACGLPVAGFDTGALNELVIGDSGRLVPYGGDPWKLEPPAIPALAEACVEILREQARFRHAARAQAEGALSLDGMTEGYLKALLEDGYGPGNL